MIEEIERKLSDLMLSCFAVAGANCLSLLSFQAWGHPRRRQEAARTPRDRLPLAPTSCLVRIQQVFDV